MRSWHALETSYRRETLRVGMVRIKEVASRVFGSRRLRRKSRVNSQFAGSVTGGIMIGDHARPNLGREMRKYLS